MELRTTREMRRSEQLNQALSKKEESADTSIKKNRAQPQRQAADRCTLSQQALRYLEEQNRMMQEAAERRARRESEGKSDLDLLAKQVDMQEKCLKIAASIMKGNRVPPEDLKYLMDNDPAGYKLAMAMRQEKKDPEDCESVLDDEDKNSAAAQESGGEAASVEPSGASGGGEAAPAQG